ncbi:MAG: hypothetical protein HYV63_26385, partial [Candidatus Schekmanbacteria bacterium]|nr:hypothetical protein [Candidatus Schekmanbacteria bacterium]
EIQRDVQLIRNAGEDGTGYLVPIASVAHIAGSTANDVLLATGLYAVGKQLAELGLKGLAELGVELLADETGAMIVPGAGRVVAGGAGEAAGAVASGAAKTVGTPPNRIYSARELIRRAEEPGPFHNFPESLNQQIFEQGTRTVTPDFYNVARPGLSTDAAMYRFPGSVNGVSGTFEIGVRPSVSGNTELIMHRFFRPNP